MSELNFKSDAELRPESGTKVNVQVFLDPEKPVNLNGTESNWGPFVSLQFQVVDGEHRGRRASLIYNIDPNNNKFRKIFEAVTGVDVSNGANTTLEDFNEKLISGVFEATIGPEKRKNKQTGQFEETGYTAIESLISRIGDRDSEAVETAAVASDVPAGGDVEEDDIPF